MMQTRRPLTKGLPPLLYAAALAALVLGLLLLFGATTAGAQTTSPLTYENWAEGFFTQNCIGCHSSHLEGADRNGAPVFFNFDTLEDIQRWKTLVRHVATGDNPSMPPAGGVWWWDRESLEEWLDAGAPGEAGSLGPITTERSKAFLDYQEATLSFSPPLGGNYAERALTIAYDKPASGQGHQNTTIYLTHLMDEGGAVMTAREWADPLTGNVRREDYTPAIPLLFRTLAYDPRPLQEWQQNVSVRERQWIGDAAAPVSDVTRTEDWRVTEHGVEETENGTHLPFKAFKVVQENLSTEVTTRLWFMESAGLVRRDTVLPSDTYLREEIHELCVFKKDQQLYNPLLGRWRQPWWIPLVGEEGDLIDPPDLDYQWQIEIRRVGVLKEQGAPTPTPTATPSATPSATPTATPSATASPTPDVSPTPFPSATPTPVVTPPATPTSAPSADLNGDGRVDWQDLLLFQEQWQQTQP